MMMHHHSDQRQQLPLLLIRLIFSYEFDKIVFLFIHTFDPFIMTIRKEDPLPSLNDHANPVMAEDADEEDANLAPIQETSEEEEEKAKKLKAVQDFLKDDKQKGEKEEKEGTICCSLKGCFWCLVTLPSRLLAAS